VACAVVKAAAQASHPPPPNKPAFPGGQQPGPASVTGRRAFFAVGGLQDRRKPPKTGGARGQGGRLWISLGAVLAQPGSYPHKNPAPQSCCQRAPRFVQPAAQTLPQRKSAPALKKNVLSTKNGLLYYYCYLYIELSKNN